MKKKDISYFEPYKSFALGNTISSKFIRVLNYQNTISTYLLNNYLYSF